MTKLESLEEYAEEHNIKVYRNLPFDKNSCAVRVKGNCSVAITSKPLTVSERNTCMAHELGHCETGSFYNSTNIHDCRGRHEYRANKWAIKRCVPIAELTVAVTAGYQEIWELAELFEVTEDLMRKAVFYYENGYIGNT